MNNNQTDNQENKVNIQINRDEIANIRPILYSIKKHVNPSEIILFHKKISNLGKIIGFKVCLIMEVEDKFEVEKNIYRHIDSEVPFDVIIYTCDEWNELKLKKHSFANNILERGYFFNE